VFPSALLGLFRSFASCLSQDFLWRYPLGVAEPLSVDVGVGVGAVLSTDTVGSIDVSHIWIIDLDHCARLS
jgi:hypothetical protein